MSVRDHFTLNPLSTGGGGGGGVTFQRYTGNNANVGPLQAETYLVHVYGFAENSLTNTVRDKIFCSLQKQNCIETFVYLFYTARLNLFLLTPSTPIDTV
jgi:hypothetical protein